MAVEQDGAALEFASESLKSEEDVVLAAIRNSRRARLGVLGSQLQRASEALRGDKEFILSVVKVRHVFQSVAPSVVLNPDPPTPPIWLTLTLTQP